MQRPAGLAEIRELTVQYGACLSNKGICLFLKLKWERNPDA